MTAPTFTAPDSLAEALSLLAQQPGQTVLAGGTDLWPQWTSEQHKPGQVLSLHRLAELGQISATPGEPLRIGATVTHAQLVRSAEVRDGCPAVAQAAATIGAAQIQNRGTIGGNLVNASPAADLPPPLVAAGAEVELASTKGTRRVPLDSFYQGYRQLDLGPGELLVAVLVPALPAVAREHFRKIGTRRAQAISKVMGACRLELGPDQIITRAGIAFGSVAPVVLRLEQLEQWLCGRRADSDTAREAGQRAVAAVQPIDDLRSSADYRRQMVGRLVQGWIQNQGEENRRTDVR